MLRFGLATWLLVAALPTQASQPPADQPASTAAEVRLVPTRSGHLLLPATVDGGKRVTFMLDTGSSVCVASGALAARMLEPVAAGQQSLWINSNGRQLQLARLKQLEAGALVFRNCQTIVLPADSPCYYLPGVPAFEGLLGSKPLRQKRLALAVYPQKRRLRFFHPGGLSAQARAAAGFGPGTFTVPLVWDARTSWYWCQVTLRRGQRNWTGWFVLDTGIDRTFVPSYVHRQLGPAPTVPTESHTALEIVPTVLTKVDAFSAGDLPPTGVEVECAEAGFEDCGLLGMNVLGRYNFLVDYVANQLYLAPMKH